MAGWLPLPSSWQKRFLSYALSRTGIFDETVLNLDNLNLTWGRQNVVELHDVALSIPGMRKLVELPRELDLTAARALKLRLTVPADILRSNIAFELDGVDVDATYGSQKEPEKTQIHGQGPSQRKMVVRLQSPERAGDTASRWLGDDEYSTAVQDMTRSFLQEKSPQEIQQLQESVGPQPATLDDSVSSASSDASAVGTGGTLGLPAFLADFLQGVVDRVQVNLKDISVLLTLRSDRPSIAFLLKIGSVRVWSTSASVTTRDTPPRAAQRHLHVETVSLDLLHDDGGTRSNASTDQPEAHHDQGESLISPELRYGTPRSGSPLSRRSNRTESPEAVKSQGSGQTTDADRYADVEDVMQQSHLLDSELDIRLGEDNLSWGSRKAHTGKSSQDLWRSMAESEALPDSLLLDSHRQPLPSLPRFSDSADDPASEVLGHSTTSARRTVVDEAYEDMESDHHDGNLHSVHADLDDTLHDRLVTQTWGDPSAISHTNSINSDSAALYEDSDLGQEGNASLYLSAVGQDSPPSVLKSRLDMPGGWTSEVYSQPQLPAKPISATSTASAGPVLNDLDTEAIETVDHSGAVTPRAASPVRVSSAPRKKRHSFSDVTNLMIINMISVSLVTSDARPADPPNARESQFLSKSRHATLSRESSSKSVDAEPQSSIPTDHLKMELAVGPISIQSDVKTTRLLSETLSPFLQSAPSSQEERQRSSDSDSKAVELAADIELISIKLYHDLPSTSASNPDLENRQSLNLVLRRVHVSAIPDHLGLTIHHIRLLNNSHNLLTIQVERQQVIATDIPVLPALEVQYLSAHTAVLKRKLHEVDLTTQTIKIDLDVDDLVRTSVAWGDLSELLDIGSPYASQAERVPVKTIGVRFEEPSQQAVSTTELKINARLASFLINVHSQAAGLALRTSSIRVVHREQAISASTAQIRLDVPSISNGQGNSITLDSVRLDFLNVPHERDLERFLALLTPSKDKYENDQDILLDTLLRQREKGSCLRITVDGCDAALLDIRSLVALQNLSAEASRLSAVTKYLPEDDRPGILSMIRLKDVNCQLPTNNRLGPVQIAFSELQCAHVGLPSLLACSLSDLTVSKDDGTAILHPLVPALALDNLPMVMMRMLGDNLEPLIQVKLHNFCVEYTVTLLMQLLDETTEVTNDQMLDDLSQSIANLAESTQQLIQPVSPDRYDATKTKVELLVRNSGIGLQPRHFQSKACLVLTDLSVASIVPMDKDITVMTDIRRGSLFITDDAAHDRSFPRRSRSSTNTATDARVADALLSAGYVSVGSMMSAKIRVQIREAGHPGQKRTDIDLSNELLLLESCADSTQTLFVILGDLAPPSPPSKDVKYLTEPMTLEDMMASFTGEPVAKTEYEPGLLFDIEDGGDSDNDLFLEASEIMAGNDDLLAESEMTSSLYGPVGGLLGDMESESQEDKRPPTEAAESLLEEDPFVMTVTPDDLPFSDTTLLKDLRQQFQTPNDGNPIKLDLYEIEDLGFDALGPDLHVLGQKSRFNLPIPRQLEQLRMTAESTVLRVRIHDTNFIWNLHDGYDWQQTRDGITSAVEKIEQRTEERLARRRTSRGDQNDEESVIEDFLFNSIYIGVPSNAEAQDIRRQINRHIDDLASETESVPASVLSRPTAYSSSGRPRHRHKLRLERSRSHKIAFELKGLAVDFNMYPPDSAEVESVVDVRINSFEIFDNVPTSTWKKFLTQLPSDDGLREIGRPMVHAKLSTVRTIQDYAATEMILRVTLTPLRLHVDQDALDFITRFFEFKDDSAKPAASPNDQPFLQRVEIDTVDLRLDYKPKKVDYAGLRSGHTTEFMNFVILDAANIRLKHAIVYGIKGFEPLHKTLNDIWMPDVRRNQLPTVLAGLAPVRSLVNIGSGVRDVVAIPIREYQKDGRVVRSIQKGAFQFGKTTASELARLGAKVAIGTQNVLQGAEGLLSPTSTRPASSRRISSEQGWHDIADDEDKEQRAISAYADQPLGVLAGLQSARRFLEHDLLTARDALIAVQGEVLSSESPGAAAAAVARHAPTVILRPVIGATRAVGTALLGVGNQIDRENLSRMDDKYKRR